MTIISRSSHSSTPDWASHVVLTHCRPWQARSRPRRCWAIFSRLSLPSLGKFCSISSHDIFSSSFSRIFDFNTFVVAGRRSPQRKPRTTSNKVPQSTQDHHPLQHRRIHQGHHRPRRCLRNPTSRPRPSLRKTARCSRDRTQAQAQGRQRSTGLPASLPRHPRLHQGQ